MTDHDPPHQPLSASKRPRLGLPLWAVASLALLAVPRVVLHDLDLIQEGTAINALLVFIPPVLWLVVAFVTRVPNPFVTILAIGVCYGIFLSIGHQLLWDVAYQGDPPQLGGNLAELDPQVDAILVRSFAAVSSLITGAAVGAIVGLLAWGLALLHRGRRPADRGAGTSTSVGSPEAHGENPRTDSPAPRDPDDARTDAAVRDVNSRAWWPPRPDGPPPAAPVQPTAAIPPSRYAPQPKSVWRSIGIGALGLVGGSLLALFVQDILAMAFLRDGAVDLPLAAGLGLLLPLFAVLGAGTAVAIDNRRGARRRPNGHER